MPKLGVTITKEMETALSRHAEERGAPVSALVREAIREWLEKRGEKVDARISWGGARRASEDGDTNSDHILGEKQKGAS